MLLNFKPTFPRLLVALKKANELETIVQHEGEALVFSYSEQKVGYENGIETFRYAYHMTDAGKHGVEDIMGCTLLDVKGVAKLAVNEIRKAGGIVGNIKAEKTIKESDENHIYFDVTFQGATYELAMHLAKLDSNYAKDTGWTVVLTCSEFLSKLPQELREILKKFRK